MRVPVRLRLGLTALVLGAVALLVLVVLMRPARIVQPPSTGFAGALRPPRIPVKPFRLRDQDGRPAALADYRGRVVVLTFLYSTCRDTCPVTAQQIRGALDRVGGDVPALAVSVDPAGDSPARARRFLARQHVAGRLRFLLGTRAQLTPVWRAYGIQPQDRGFEHSAEVVVLDRSGRQRVGFPVSQLTPEGLAHDIRRLGGGGT